MSGPQSRLSRLAAHFLPSASLHSNPQCQPRNNYHALSPTFFLPRAAAIEPDVVISVQTQDCLADFWRRLKQYITSLRMERSCGDHTKKPRIALEAWRITSKSMGSRELAYYAQILPRFWSQYLESLLPEQSMSVCSE